MGGIFLLVGCTWPECKTGATPTWKGPPSSPSSLFPPLCLMDLQATALCGSLIESQMVFVSLSGLVLSYAGLGYPPPVFFIMGGKT